MARNERRRQKAGARHKRRRSSRKAEQQSAAAPAFDLLAIKTVIRHARECPIHECLIGAEWKENGLAHILLSRRQPDGLILFGAYLVDTLCLGLKSTFCNAGLSPSSYERELKPGIHGHETQVPCPAPLAHEIIYGAIRYARRLGFRPHKDFGLSQCVLEPEGHFEGTSGVEFGRDWKPHYMAGPRDNVRRILGTLKKSVGEGNFDFTIPFGRPGDLGPDAWA